MLVAYACLFAGVSIIKNQNILSKIILSLVGILFGLGLAIAGFVLLGGDFRLLPTFIHDDVVVFREGNGDILFWQSEFIAPLESPDEILSVHRLSLDENGFRLPANPSESYSVTVLGDSFTEGANVATPWSDVFAETTGLTTRNLGFRGYGSRHYAWVWQEYGLQENPNVVIIGFFGGNDVYTAGLEIETPYPEPLEERAQDSPPSPVTIHSASDTEIIYPIYLDNGTPITFLSTYISWMNTDQDQLLGSVNYATIENSLSEIQQSADEDTCLVFVYFPSKAEVYFPYLNDADYPSILEGQKQVLINSDGTLHIVEDFDISVERVLNRYRNTGIVFTELADSLGYHSLNLQPVFDEYASNGEVLYYTYDTHWNQAGQTLAGETIAEFVLDNCTLPES